MVGIFMGVVFCLLGAYLFNFLYKEKINSIIGFRTSLSMKNKDTWAVSQRVGGVGLLIAGTISIIYGLYSEILITNSSSDSQSIVCAVIVLIAVLISNIYIKTIFNKDGSRKNKYKGKLNK